jgi:hypothetical protein
MITLEMQCRGGFHLVDAFRAGIRDGEFRSFDLKRGRGRSRARAVIVHKSPRTPGQVRLEQLDDLCIAKVSAPAGKEWDILHKFVGRLVHRFAQELFGIRIQFPTARSRRRR